MAFYEVFQNTGRSHNGDYANGNIVLIKDGFCWPALFFTPFWLIFRGMWLVLALYIGVSLIIVALAELNYIDPSILFWLNLGISLIFAYEANFLRKWTLQRRKYNHVGVTLGNNIREAEVGFFAQFINPNKVDVEPQYSAADEVNPVPADMMAKNSSQMVVNPVNENVENIHRKSHWKIGGKRKSDSVVGMFSDD